MQIKIFLQPNYSRVGLEITLKNCRRKHQTIGVQIKNEHLYSLNFVNDHVDIVEELQ